MGSTQVEDLMLGEEIGRFVLDLPFGLARKFSYRGDF